MLPLAAGTQKVQLLAYYYRVKLMSNSIFFSRIYLKQVLRKLLRL